MIHLFRNMKRIYLCNKFVENEREIFSEPTEYKLNVQPLSNSGEIIAFGEDFRGRLAIYTSEKKAKNFHNGDRCYVFEDVPDIYDKFCTTADYFVDGEPLIYFGEATIYLQRMTSSDSDYE